MKIIHTADIHLDSALNYASNPSQRRLELLQALAKLGEYANINNVEGIIVAGDLFDDKFATQKTVRSVADIINASNATWFVLRGNHGDATPYEKLCEICSKVKVFREDWTSYRIGNVHICGRELGSDDEAQWQQLQLPTDCYNILVLHGDVDDDSYGVIDKKAIAKSGANYVALGHRHSFANYKFGKSTVAYSGVLEARGFDEKDPTGFVVIDTESGVFTFVKQAIRSVETVVVDVTGIQSEIALENLVMQHLATFFPRNYLNLVLVGTLDEQINVNFVNTILQDKCFALRVDNQTQPNYDLQKLAQEMSLRGEFVRQVLQLPAEQRAEVLKMGLTLLNGGDLQ